MKIKWGLQIIDRTGLNTPEDWLAAYEKAEPIFFRTVKDCFDYLGFKLTRLPAGYAEYKGKYSYCLTKYRADYTRGCN